MRLHQGQQAIEGIGIFWQDHGARMANLVLNTWSATDPLAHQAPFQSTYNYMGADPVNRVDPGGRSDGWVGSLDRLAYMYGNHDSPGWSGTVGLFFQQGGQWRTHQISSLEGSGGTGGGGNSDPSKPKYVYDYKTGDYVDTKTGEHVDFWTYMAWLNGSNSIEVVVTGSIGVAVHKALVNGTATNTPIDPSEIDFIFGNDIVKSKFMEALAYANKNSISAFTILVRALIGTKVNERSLTINGPNTTDELGLELDFNTRGKKSQNYDPETNSIYWNHGKHILSDKKVHLNPFSLLGHELSHAYDYVYKKPNMSDAQYRAYFSAGGPVETTAMQVETDILYFMGKLGSGSSRSSYKAELKSVAYYNNLFLPPPFWP